MYFYQFNIYAKGSLFTEIVVFFMMVTFGIVSYLIYRADDTLKASKIAFVSYISLLSLIILIFKGYIYSSNTLLTKLFPKFLLDWVISWEGRQEPSLFGINLLA